jgi:hypothetical protein
MGRPLTPYWLKRVHMPVRLPRWLVFYIQQHIKRNPELIEQAIIKQYGLDLPSTKNDKITQQLKSILMEFKP